MANAFYYWNCASQIFAEGAAKKQAADRDYPIYVFGQDAQPRNVIGTIPTWWNIELPSILAVFPEAQLEYRFHHVENGKMVDTEEEMDKVRATLTGEIESEAQNHLKEVLTNVSGMKVFQISFLNYMENWDTLTDAFPNYSFPYEGNPILVDEAKIQKFANDIKESLKNQA